MATDGKADDSTDDSADEHGEAEPGLFGLGAQDAPDSWQRTGEQTDGHSHGHEGDGEGEGETIRIPLESVGAGVMKAASDTVTGVKALANYTLAGALFGFHDTRQLAVSCYQKIHKKLHKQPTQET